tara:strand:- start:373 stop:561 length:189 start_codon:yes stop_codon:yes gene_type:complete
LLAVLAVVVVDFLEQVVVEQEAYLVELYRVHPDHTQFLLEEQVEELEAHQEVVTEVPHLFQV